MSKVDHFLHPQPERDMGDVTKVSVTQATGCGHVTALKRQDQRHGEFTPARGY